MTAQTDYRRGLTIPAHIAATLPRDLIKILKKDGHGISFTSDKSAQMRYIYNKKDFGGSYPVSRYGGNWHRLLIAAMADYVRLGQKIPNSARFLSPDKGVRFYERYQKSKGDIAQYSWVIHYKIDGKNRFKALYCGNENTMTTTKKKHAELTAWYLRRLYCESGDPDVFSSENTKGWQHIKLYESGVKHEWK